MGIINIQIEKWKQKANDLCITKLVPRPNIRKNRQ